MSTIPLGSNIAALKTGRALSQSAHRLERFFERLSSGSRINRASDDAAGLSIASRLNADVRVYTQAIRNASDGISALSIADGTVSQLSSVVTRLKELAIQSANGSLGLNQRRALNEEAHALTKEFNRVVSTTKFNGLSLFNLGSSMRLQLGYGVDGSIAITPGQGLGRNIGNGTFQSAVTSTITDASGITNGDFNRDGRLDLVTRNSTDGNIAVRIQNSDGTFAAPVNYATGGGGTGGSAVVIEQADLNNDGIVDLVTRRSATALAVFLGTGNGTFQSAISITNGGNSFGITINDFNGDGNADIISTLTTGFSVTLGNGNGTFQASQITDGIDSVISYDIKSSDLDGDGIQDLVMAGSTSGYVMLRGQGNGTFGPAQVIDSGVGSSRSTVAVGDFNRDGVADIAIEGGILTGRGNGTFNPRVSMTTGGTTGMRATDLNGDGYLDLIANGGYQLGHGDGTFDPVQLLGEGLVYTSGDFNGDGSIDVYQINGSSLSQLDFFAAVTVQNTEIEHVNIATREGALAAVNMLDAVSERLAREVGLLGANMSRVESALSVLRSSRENLETARGRIVDADIASDASNLLRESILQQVGAALLGQANLQPQIALQLLRG